MPRVKEAPLVGGPLKSLLLDRLTHRTVWPVAVSPVSDDLTRGGAVVYCAGPASLTSGHVAEDILDQAAVGEGTLPLFSGALVGMEEQHQLLLDQLQLLRVR